MSQVTLYVRPTLVDMDNGKSTRVPVSEMKKICKWYHEQLDVNMYDGAMYLDEAGVESVKVRNTYYLIILSCTLCNSSRDTKKLLELDVAGTYPVIIDGKKYRVVGNLIE